MSKDQEEYDAWWLQLMEDQIREEELILAQDDGTRHLVFVYGSLKMGFGNHSVLGEDADFLGTYNTDDDHYLMCSYKAYPAVLDMGEGEDWYKIEGELYEVNPLTLLHLDRLEGNGSFYQRKEIRLDGHDDLVWMYCLLGDGPNCFERVAEIEEKTLAWMPGSIFDYKDSK